MVSNYVIEAQALPRWPEAAFGDINSLVAPGHLAQLRQILFDPRRAPTTIRAMTSLRRPISPRACWPMCHDNRQPSSS